MSNLIAESIDCANSWLSQPKVLAEKILNRPSITCSITIPYVEKTNTGTTTTTITIPFYMENDFSFSLTNKWGKMVDMSAVNTFEELINATALFRTSAKDRDKGKAQISLQSAAMSAKVWKESEFGGFTVNCLFLATNRKINPVEVIKILAGGALPTKYDPNDSDVNNEAFDATKSLGKFLVGGISTIASYALTGVSTVTGGRIDTDSMKQNVSNVTDQVNTLIDDVGLVAPLKYGLKVDPDSTSAIVPRDNTTLTLYVGDWFAAKHLVITQLSGVTFSKELIAPYDEDNMSYLSNDVYRYTPTTTDYGFPLYAKCTLNLEPVTILTYEKFKEYFKIRNTSVLSKVSSWASIGG